MNIFAPTKSRALLIAAMLCFVSSIFSVASTREGLRAEERRKNEARRAQIVLRDEWRTLSLEYATLTGYNEISAHAQRLGMVKPQPGQDTFFYLVQPEGDK